MFVEAVALSITVMVPVRSVPGGRPLSETVAQTPFALMTVGVKL